MRLTEIILHVIECKQQNVNSGFNKIGFRIFANGQKPPQRPRIDSNKRFLPRPNTTTA
jgi:hypothetical protein